MMLTFHMTGRCSVCDAEAHGTRMSFPERINLNSVPVKQSLSFWKKDCSHHGADVVWDGHMRLDEASAAAVEKAREKIRARRRRSA